jgi:hypothetical protein
VFLVQAKAPTERPWSIDTRRLLFSRCIAITPSGLTLHPREPGSATDSFTAQR